MSSEVILVTSFKGGCGKSSVSANIAHTLAAKGKRVLLVSLDRYSRGTDAFFEGECAGVLDVSDFPDNTLEEICRPFAECAGLSLASSMPFADKDPSVLFERSMDFISEASRSGKYDFILIDKGFTTLEETLSLSSVSNKICIVSSQSEDSLESAALLVSLLRDSKMSDDALMLVLNSFFTDPSSVDSFPGVCEIINSVKANLLGIIPFSEELYIKQTLSQKANDKLPYQAYLNISERLMGSDIKFLDFLPQKIRRVILNNGC